MYNFVDESILYGTDTVWSYQGLLLTKQPGMYFVVIQHDNIIVYSEKIVLNK